jgi:hypothetical protein
MTTKWLFVKLPHKVSVPREYEIDSSLPPLQLLRDPSLKNSINNSLINSLTDRDRDRDRDRKNRGVGRGAAKPRRSFL